MMTDKRPAFSMIVAIFVIVLLAALGALVTSMSGKIVKTSSAQYLREQSILLAQSYTGYAVMALTANEQNTSGCLNDITGSYGKYKIDVKLSYIDGAQINGNCRKFGSGSILSAETPKNVIVDVFVRYPDPDQGDHNITYHRRTLQKI